MNTTIYLYLITHTCRHIASYHRSAPLTRDEYYQLMASPCPACRAKAEAEAKTAAPAEVPEPILGRSAVWKRGRQACAECGKLASLREHDGRRLCRTCYREAGAMDGRNGVCEECGKMRQRRYAGGRMLCRACINVSRKGAGGK